VSAFLGSNVFMIISRKLASTMDRTSLMFAPASHINATSNRKSLGILEEQNNEQ